LVVVQGLKEGFPNINDARHGLEPDAGAEDLGGLFGNRFTFSHSTTGAFKLNCISFLANGEAPPKLPQAANCCYFLTIIVLVYSLSVLYVSVQALSRRIQCLIGWGSFKTPQEMPSFYEA
jgi:hypothetical protein